MAEKKKDKETALVSQPDTRKPVYSITGKAPLLETNVDRLHKLVIERKRIGVPEAAKKFGVTEDTIIEWAEILEEHKLVRLHYPIAGKPSLGTIMPEPLKGERGKKPKKPGTPFRKRFTKKVIFIYIEVIVLGELLIYIFLVNRYLAMNFIPTVRFHLDGFTSYLLNLPAVLASGNPSRLLSQPMYFAFLVILLVIIILIIILVIKSRKPGFRPEKKTKKKEKKEKKQKKSKGEGKGKKGKEGFTDVIERYKERLKEMG